MAHGIEFGWTYDTGSCEVARATARRIGLPESTQRALRLGYVPYHSWDVTSNDSITPRRPAGAHRPSLVAPGPGRLLDGPQRFAQLAADIPGVSRRMLTERLRELETASIIVRHVDAGPPISVSYALAKQADELEAALRAFKAWAATKPADRGQR